MVNLIEIKKINFMSGIKCVFDSLKSTVNTKESYLFFLIFFLFSYFAIDVKEQSLAMMDAAPVNENGEVGVNLPILSTFLYMFIFSIFKLFSPIIMANYKKGKTIVKSFLVIASPKIIGRFLLSILSLLFLFLVLYKVFSLDGDTTILMDKITQHQNGEIVTFSEDFKNKFITKAFSITFLMSLFLFLISFSYYITFVLNKGVGVIESMKLSFSGTAKNIIPFFTLIIFFIAVLVGVEELKLIIGNTLISLFLNSFMFILAINLWECFSRKTFVESDI